MAQSADFHDTISKTTNQIPDDERAVLCDRLIAVMGEFNSLVDIFHYHYFKDGHMVDLGVVQWELQTLLNDIRYCDLADLARLEQEREQERARLRKELKHGKKKSN